MAAELAPASKVLSHEDILNVAENRLRKYRDRDTFYDVLLSYYLGGGSGKSTLPVLASNSQGRPLLRQIGEQVNANQRYTSNRLAPIVDDFSALIGRMPNSRVEAPDSSPEGQEKAIKLTKYLLSTYDLSGMDTQHALAGFHLSCLGDSVTMLEPEPDKLRVVWNVISPRNAYPSFWHGYRRFEVYDMVTIEVMSVDDVKRQLEVTPLSDKPEDCTVITFISPYQRTIILGSDQGRSYIIRNVEWDLGFCPAAWTFNKVTGQMGMSDIKDSLSAQDLNDWGINLWADGLVYMSFPPFVVKNPMDVDGDLTVGPGETIAVQGDGDLKAVPTGADSRFIQQIIQQANGDMNTAAGTSTIRQEGQMHGSIQTGRAIHSAQGPQSTRIEFRQQVIGRSWERLNSMTLTMQEKAPFISEKPIEIFGRLKGVSFQDKLDPKKDIDGWTRNIVTWDTLVGMNLQQKLQIAFEGLQAKIWDDLHARELVGVDDPFGMRERIASQMKFDAQLMQEVQGGAQPGPGGPAGAPPGPPQEQNPATTPAPQIMRPPGLMPPGGGAVQGGVPRGVTRQAVADALGKVATKLKGTVWAIGELAMSAQAMTATLAISDHRDYNTVMGAVTPLDPKAKVRALKKGEADLPAEAVRLI